MAKYPTQKELLEVFELRVVEGEELLFRRAFVDKKGCELNEKLVKNKVNHWSGYCYVQFKERVVKYHQIVYILVNGDIPDGFSIDHIDCDRINNHSSNLQIATPREQQQGMTIHRIDGKLVGYTKCGDRFQALIKVKGKPISLGCYNTAEEAHEAYLWACEIAKEDWRTPENIQGFFDVKPTKNNPMKGATFHNASGKWEARTYINGKQIHLGCFSTQEEAYEAILIYKGSL